MCWGGVEHARDNLETRGHDVTLLFSMSPMCSLLGAITARRIILNLLCRAVPDTLETTNKIAKYANTNGGHSLSPTSALTPRAVLALYCAKRPVRSPSSCLLSTTTVIPNGSSIH